MSIALEPALQPLTKGDKEGAAKSLSEHLTATTQKIMRESYFDDDARYDADDSFTEKEKTPFSETFTSHGMNVVIKGNAVRPSRSRTKYYGRQSPPETTVTYGNFESFDNLEVYINGLLAFGDGFEPTEKEIYSDALAKMVYDHIGYMYEWKEDPEFLEKVWNPIQKNPAVAADIAAAIKQIHSNHGAGTEG